MLCVVGGGQLRLGVCLSMLGLCSGPEGLQPRMVLWTSGRQGTWLMLAEGAGRLRLQWELPGGRSSVDESKD